MIFILILESKSALALISQYCYQILRTWPKASSSLVFTYCFLRRPCLNGSRLLERGFIFFSRTFVIFFPTFFTSIYIIMQREWIETEFNKANIKRNQLSDIPNQFLERISFMEYRIRKQLKSFTLLSICGGNRKDFTVNAKYQRAFNTLNLKQKVDEYSMVISTAVEVIRDLKQEKDLDENFKQIKIRLNIYGKHKNNTNVTIRDFKVFSVQGGNFNIDLRNYLLRKSKKKDNNWYVLEPIKNCDLDTIRFCFINYSEEMEYLPVIQQRLKKAEYVQIYKVMDELCKRKNQIKNRQSNSSFRIKLAKEKEEAESKVSKQFLSIPDKDEIISLGNQSRCNRSSICEDLVKSLEEQSLADNLSEYNDERNQSMQKINLFTKQKLNQNQKKKKNYQKNIFRILMPYYPYEHLPSLNHFTSVYLSEKTSLFVYHHTKSNNLFKLKLNVKLSPQVTCKAIYNAHLFKNWHPEIKQGQIKMNISSENSCILYQQHKAFNEWYRCRDFVILSHLFKFEQNYYIAQKSIEHSNFIPFYSITRGSIEYMIWKIQKKGEEECDITAQIKIVYEGMLNKSHQKQLTIKYLKGFENMEEYFLKIQNIGKLTANMSMDWEITENNYFDSNQRNQSRISDDFQTVDFEDGPSEISEQDEIFYSIENVSDDEEEVLNDLEKSEHQIQEATKEEKLMVKTSKLSKSMKSESFETFDPYLKQELAYDEQGLIILPQTYLKKKFRMTPFEAEIINQTYPNDNVVLKNHWELKKSGGLKLICKKKIEAQNNVFSFIMKTMRKNLMSGKGMLNISLPVQIFNFDSNIQRLCSSMALAPRLLQRAVQQKDPFERLCYCLSFGFSNSILFFDVQKPFNPILGETYQGFIRGCPIYAEQISHHPPISSLYFIGRGYKVYGSLEGRVYIHLNSGDGVNWGFYHIIFDDGEELLYQSPPGELSGLSFGDRCYNFKSKAYILDMKNGLYGEIRFQDTGGFFGKNKLEYDDEIRGQVYKVTKDFFSKFISSDKRATPAGKQIIQKKCDITGRWPYTIQFNRKAYYNIINDLPDMLADELYPLHSNSLYREDLQYRKNGDLARSQIEKERLQIIQRKDRKLREQMWGKSH